MSGSAIKADERKAKAQRDKDAEEVDQLAALQLQNDGQLDASGLEMEGRYPSDSAHTMIRLVLPQHANHM